MASESDHAIRRRTPKWALKTAPDRLSSQPYYLHSIGRALNVLDCFDGESPLELKDVVAGTKLPESALLRVLLTLKKHGYLEQAADESYQLSPKLRFGWTRGRGEALRELARPELELLTGQFNETASLAYLFEDRIHVLDSIESFHKIRVSNCIGRVLPPHCSAMGKAITAFQQCEVAYRIVELYGLLPRTEYTITYRANLMREFEEIRRTGIACDREESMLGGICYGAAIRRANQPVVAALSVSTPALRLSPDREQKIRRALLQSAERVAQVVS